MRYDPRDPEGNDDAIAEISATLPTLPDVIRYFDDYEGAERSIAGFAGCMTFSIQCDGQKHTYDFHRFGKSINIFRHVVADWFARLDPTTVNIRIRNILSLIDRLGLRVVEDIITIDMHRARTFWELQLKPLINAMEGSAVRAMLHSLCSLSIGSWSPIYRDIVRALPGHPVDKYRTIRAGDCFLPLSHQARVIEYFDDLVTIVKRSESSVGYEELRDACVLLVIFQYAFRPGQVARIDVADVRVIAPDVVHMSVMLTKQRGSSTRHRVTRRVKREWAPLVRAFLERREAPEENHHSVRPERLLFQLTPTEVSHVVIDLCRAITDDDWTPTDLRHSAAQRMADAGVSRVGLSEFMGHASKQVVNVYFDSSPTQAQRVNQAMAISPIYSNVAKVARNRTIDKEMLLSLPEDQQVAGIPHGIPIEGVGGCGIGQSRCPKSPVLSCYDCRQFMPLRDPEIHRSVLRELRPVVADFASLSTNAAPSPAFTQLRSTLEAVRAVVESLTSEEDKEDKEDEEK